MKIKNIVCTLQNIKPLLYLYNPVLTVIPMIKFISASTRSNDLMVNMAHKTFL